MEDDIAVRLKKWADEMGYVHRKGYLVYSSADFNKLCKNKTKRLWEETVSKVKPISQLDHIRKNILLSRICKGTHLRPDVELSGSLGREVKNRHELNQLQQQKQLLLDKINSDEASIRDMQQTMKKYCAKRSFQESQLKEAQLKAELSKIKKRDCESLKSWLDDTSSTAKSLCSVKGEASVPPGKDLSVPALEKCIELVQDYQAWCKESSLENVLLVEDHYSEQERRKLALWKSVTAVIGKIPPEQVWNSLHCNFMEKGVSEMASLASSVDIVAELNTLREASSNRAKPNQDLSAMYLKSMADAADHRVKVKIFSRKLEEVLKQKATEAEKSMHADKNLSINSQPSRDRILDLLRLRCRRVKDDAVKKALTDLLAEMRLKTQDLSSYAQRLQEERATVTHLDNKIAEIKLAVEQNLSSIHDIESKLRRAQQDVIDELNAFAVKCTVANEVVANDSCNESINSTISSTRRLTMFNSTAVTTNDSFIASTPALDKLKCREFFRMDESGVTNVSTGSSPPKISFRETVSTLRNAVSNESKSFFKIPLDFVPKAKLSSSTGNVSDVVVESPALVAQLSCTGALKDLMHLSPSHISTDDLTILVHVYQNLGHVRAAQLQQLVSQCSPPTAICAGLSQQYLKVTAPIQDTNIREQLRNIVTVIENTKGDIAEGRETFYDWVQRSVQGMIPTSLQVEGKSMKEWKSKYDSLVD